MPNDDQLRSAKLEFFRRIGDEIDELADYLGIPSYRLRRGDKPARVVWDWLEDRGEIGKLPEALRAIGRDDLVREFDHPQERDEGEPEGSGPGTARMARPHRLDTEPISACHARAAEAHTEGAYALAIQELDGLMAKVHTDRVTVLLYSGKVDEAETALRAAWWYLRSVGAENDHPDVLAVRHAEGGLLFARGELPLAEDAFRQVAVRRAKRLGPEHPDTLRTRYSIATVQAERGALRSSREEFVSVLATQRGVLGEKHVETLDTWRGLCAVLEELGELQEAAREYSDLVVAAGERLGPKHPDVIAIRRDSARVYAQLASDGPR